MERKSAGGNIKLARIAEIMKKAYEKGQREKEITVEALIADLKSDLENIIAN